MHIVGRPMLKAAVVKMTLCVVQSGVLFTYLRKVNYKPSIHRRQSSYHSRLEPDACWGTQCRRHLNVHQISRSHRNRVQQQHHRLRLKRKSLFKNFLFKTNQIIKHKILLGDQSFVYAVPTEQIFIYRPLGTFLDRMW